MTVNNSPNNKVVFFFVSDLKIVYHINYQSSITKRGKNILCHNLFGDKMIQNCLKIDAVIIMKQETQKMIAFPVN